MNEKNEIEIYYHYSELDKEHCYGVVCKHRSENYGNYWVLWLWYRMGESFTEQEKKGFRLLPYNCAWNKNERLIKKYKSVNRGVELVVPAIRKHFNKIKYIPF